MAPEGASTIAVLTASGRAAIVDSITTAVDVLGLPGKVAADRHAAEAGVTNQSILQTMQLGPADDAYVSLALLQVSDSISSMGVLNPTGDMDSLLEEVNISADQDMSMCVKYLLDASLLEAQLLNFPPHIKAAAAFAVASMLLGRHLGLDLLLVATRCTLDDLRLPMQLMLALHRVLYQCVVTLPEDEMYAVCRLYLKPSARQVALLPPMLDQDPRLALVSSGRRQE